MRSLEALASRLVDCAKICYTILMMRIRLTTSISLSLATILTTSLVGAQTAIPVTNIALPVGAMFEVLALANVSEPAVSWTMTHENVFLDSRRGRSYQTRLIRPGRYVLQGTVTDEQSSRQIARQFVVTVRQESVTNIPAAVSGSILAETLPERDAAGRIVSDEPVPVLKIVLSPDATPPFQLDPDPLSDTDSDGDPKNDQFVRGTGFAESGTPLFLWFTEEQAERMIVLSAGDKHRTELRIVSSETAQIEDEEHARLQRENPEIIRTPRGAGSMGFGADLADKPYADEPLLLHWDFGDSHQSLLDRPIHTYGRSDTYDVKLTVTNLLTGEVEDEFVSVAEIETASPEPVPEPQPEPGPEPEPEPEPEPLENGSPLFGTILKVLLVAGLSIAAGFAVMFILARILRRRGLRSAVDTFEEKLLEKKQEQVSVIATPAPAMKLPEEEPEPATQVVASEPEVIPADKKRTEPEPIDTSDIPDGRMPAWLADGMDQDEQPESEPVESRVPATEPPPQLLSPPSPESSVSSVASASSPKDSEDADDSEESAARIPLEQWAKLTPEERERERRRLKRRRYRQNKRQRIQEEIGAEIPADTDVQFIVSADSLNGNKEPPASTDEDEQKAA